MISQKTRRLVPVAIGVVLLAVVLSGCAAKRVPPPQAAIDCWNGFQNRYGMPTSASGLAANASLSWRQGKKTARIILDLWGNFDAPQTFRMDAWSNVGGNLSYILEDEQGIAALYPDPSRVYTHNDPVTGAKMLGLPFPFSLSHLASLLAGDFGALVPTEFHSAAQIMNNGWEYTFTEGPVTRIGLDGFHRPKFLEGPATAWVRDDNGEPRTVSAGVWRIDFSKYDDPGDGSVGQPARMDLHLPPESSGILRIKTRELTVEPWPNKAMKLTIPDTAEIRTLDLSPRDWTTGRAPEATGEETP